MAAPGRLLLPHLAPVHARPCRPRRRPHLRAPAHRKMAQEAQHVSRDGLGVGAEGPLSEPCIAQRHRGVLPAGLQRAPAGNPQVRFAASRCRRGPRRLRHRFARHHRRAHGVLPPGERRPQHGAHPARDHGPGQKDRRRRGRIGVPRGKRKRQLGVHGEFHQRRDPNPTFGRHRWARREHRRAGCHRGRLQRCSLRSVRGQPDGLPHTERHVRAVEGEESCFRRRAADQ
mmetsp:Transcript_117351/g.336643  ORF Transcript_117351/g.336643 Transcript_117351/m.336643 type:complete len:229 (-) Transcript_117351:1382-2068(-)